MPEAETEMAVREVRMCDAVVRPELRLKEQETRPDVLDRDKGAPCDNVFKATCSVCKEDRCERHLGKAQIRSQISLVGVRENPYVLGAQPIDLFVCIFCADDVLKAMNKRGHTIRHVIKTDPEEIVSAIRGRLTEHALAERHTPKASSSGVGNLLDTDDDGAADDV